jgi:hypothetical protein
MQVMCKHLNLACSEFGVFRARASAANFAFNRDAIFHAQVACLRYQRGVNRRVEHHLHQSRAVAQVHKHQSAQVADAMHPTVQAHCLPDMFRAQDAALVCPLPSCLHTQARLYPFGRIWGRIFGNRLGSP